MSFTNTPRKRGKSITDLMREAIAEDLSVNDCAAYVSRRISTRRVSQKRLKEIFYDLKLNDTKL